jgi:hypothetical protein
MTVSQRTRPFLLQCIIALQQGCVYSPLKCFMSLSGDNLAFVRLYFTSNFWP